MDAVLAMEKDSDIMSTSSGRIFVTRSESEGFNVYLECGTIRSDADEPKISFYN
jgi:hypothetical protein